VQKNVCLGCHDSPVDAMNSLFYSRFNDQLVSIYSTIKPIWRYANPRCATDWHRICG